MVQARGVAGQASDPPWMMIEEMISHGDTEIRWREEGQQTASRSPKGSLLPLASGRVGLSGPERVRRLPLIQLSPQQKIPTRTLRVRPP
jgi:hypothetical protein